MVSALDDKYPNTEDKGFVYSPLFFVRGGYIDGRTLGGAGYNGNYWSNTVQSATIARRSNFTSGGSNTQNNSYRLLGLSLRCVTQSEPPEIRVLLLGPYSLCVEDIFMYLIAIYILADIMAIIGATLSKVLVVRIVRVFIIVQLAYKE